MKLPELSRDRPESLGPTKWFFKGLPRRIALKRRHKVFVISMGKTGTTSLAKALNRLGYRVAGAFHKYPDKDDLSYSTLLEMGEDLIPYFDAFQDTPWFLFYKDLSQRYDDAKFIFIDRHSDSWYKSFIKHQGGKPKAHFEFIYGVDDVKEDREKVVKVYEKHRNMVKSYFSDKQHRILFVDINELSYQRICSFLNIKDIPLEKFPHSNKANVRSTLELRIKRLLKSLWKRNL